MKFSKLFKNLFKCSTKKRNSKLRRKKSIKGVGKDKIPKKAPTSTKSTKSTKSKPKDTKKSGGKKGGKKKK